MTDISEFAAMNKYRTEPLYFGEYVREIEARDRLLRTLEAE